MTNIHIRASEVLAKQAIGYNGLIVDDPRNVEKDFINLAESATHVVDLALSSASGSGGDTVAFSIATSTLASLAYTVTTTVAATTVALDVAEVVNDWNSSSTRTQYAIASVNGNSVRFTAIWPGAAYLFTISAQSGTGITVAAPSVATTGADAVEAPFGAGVLAATFSRTSNLNITDASYGRSYGSAGTVSGSVPGIAALVGDKIKISFLTSPGSESGSGFVTVQLGENVEVMVFSVPSGDRNTMRTNVVAAVNDTTLATAVAESADGVLTATAARLGEKLTINITQGGTNAYPVTLDTEPSSESPHTTAQLQFLMKGIVAYKPTMYAATTPNTTATGVPAGEEGVLLEEGYFLYKITDVVSDALAIGQSLYVGSTGTERGKLFSVTGSGRVLWQRCKVEAAARGSFYLCRLLPLS